MARSVTGLFTDQRHVDRIVGALIDAGFGAERISAVSPDDHAAGGPRLRTRAQRAAGAPAPGSSRTSTSMASPMSTTNGIRSRSPRGAAW